MMHRRKFSTKDKVSVMQRHNNRCAMCREPFTAENPADLDHEIPLELGGKDDASNLQPLHVACHKIKTRRDIKLIAKSRRIRKKLAGVVKPKRPICSPGFPKHLRKKLRTGAVERRDGRAHIA